MPLQGWENSNDELLSRAKMRSLKVKYWKYNIIISIRNHVLFIPPIHSWSNIINAAKCCSKYPSPDSPPPHPIPDGDFVMIIIAHILHLSLWEGVFSRFLSLSQISLPVTLALRENRVYLHYIIQQKMVTTNTVLHLLLFLRHHQ